MRKYTNLLVKKHSTGGSINVQFSMNELKQALMSVRRIYPGKDEICSKMIKQLSDTSLNVILKLFNMDWKDGKLPSAWKHGVLIPIAKPGKYQSNPLNYRPIDLTSNLCKLMERMAMTCLIYVLESKGLLNPHQNGFRKGCRL